MSDATDVLTRPVLPRLPALDIARTAALCAMALYHFVYDLELFRLIPPGTALSGGWRVLALCTAGSFLTLAGVSLWLAHGGGIRWGKFWRRFAMIAGAALLVSAATFFAMPDAFIYFGILHAIALCSLLGLACLRLPVAVLLAVAAFCFWAPFALRSVWFDMPALYWVGLSTAPRLAADFVPLLPWFGPFLVGLALAKLASWASAWSALEGVETRATRILAWPGRHSLAIYLLHQPVLIGLIWLGLYMS